MRNGNRLPIAPSQVSSSFSLSDSHPPRYYSQRNDANPSLHPWFCTLTSSSLRPLLLFNSGSKLAQLPCSAVRPPCSSKQQHNVQRLALPQVRPIMTAEKTKRSLSKGLLGTAEV